jgi:hypothetical protein
MSLSLQLRMGFSVFHSDGFLFSKHFRWRNVCCVAKQPLLRRRNRNQNMSQDADPNGEASDQIRKSGENWKGFLESDGNGKSEGEPSASRLSSSDALIVPSTLSMPPPPPSKRRSISIDPFLSLHSFFRFLECVFAFNRLS